MTTLTLPTQRDASLPSMGDQEYLVLGRPMNAIVYRVIEAKSAFVEATRFTFWQKAFAADLRDIGVDAEVWRATPVSPDDLQLATDFGVASMLLVETELLRCED